VTVDSASVSAAHTMIDAVYADRLVIADVLLRPGFTTPTSFSVRGVSCQGCAAFLFERVTVQGGTASAANQLDFTGLALDRSSGTIRALSIGPVLDVWIYRGVRVTQPFGTVVIDGATIAATAFGNTSDAILVDDAPSGSVTVQDSYIDWPVHGATSGSIFAGVRMRRTSSFAVNGVQVGSATDLDIGPLQYSEYAAFSAIDSNGAFTDSHAALALSASTTRTVGFQIVGPKGGVSLTDCGTTGFGAGDTRLVSVSGVDTGLPRVIRGDFRSDGHAEIGSQYGLYLLDTVADIAGAPARVAGRGTAYGAFVQGSTVKVERSTIRVTGDRALVDHAYGVYQQTGNTEIYDSFIYGGDAASFSIAVYLGADPMFLGGTTLATGRSDNSIALQCVSGAITARGNLVTVDGLTGDFLYQTAPSCVVAASWGNNAFHKTCPAGAYEGVDAVATAPPGSADAEGDRLLTSSCFDPQHPWPDPRILPGSACVGNGGTPLRRDGSTRTLDLYRGPRVVGGAMDIGAHESP